MQTRRSTTGRGARLLIAAALSATSWLLPVTASAQSGPTVDAATEQQKEEAGKAFQDAMTHFEAKRFEEALTGFRASYAIVASPNSRLMIARSLAELGRHVEAYEEAVGAAEAAEKLTEPKYVDAAKAARTEAANSQAKIALVTIQVPNAPQGSRVTMGGREIDSARWGKPIATAPGEVSVTLAGPAGTQTKSATVAAGGAATIDFAPPAKPPPPPVAPPADGAEASTEGFRPLGGGSDQRLVSYVAAGVGVVGAVGFVVFGAMHNAKYGKLEDECPSGRCAADLESDADAGRNYQTLANIGLVVGVVGLGAGAALFFTSSPDRDRTASSRTPAVAVGPGSLRVVGRF